MKSFTRLLATVMLTGVFVLAASVASASASAAQLGGVNVHSLWDDETDAQMDSELNLAASANVTVLRVDVGWSAYEGDGPGLYSAPRVAKLDRFMQGAASRGIRVLPVVFSTPCWASSAPDSELQGCTGDWWNRGVTAYPPKDPQTYGNFLKWMTGRYGAYMAGVEVWNEPNETGSWNTSDPAGAYAGLLKAGYAGAKAGDVNVPVIAGAIAGADVGFLDQLYAAGIKGSYDGLSIHTYSGTKSPLFDPGSVGRQATVLPGMQAIHAAQLAVGDTTPLWLTEFGWVTQAGLYSAVTEQAQADFISSAITTIRQLPYVRAAIVYDLRDGPDPTNYMDHYGLVTENFTPKPAFAALQAALAPAATTSPGSGSAGPTSTPTGTSTTPVGTTSTPGNGANTPPPVTGGLPASGSTIGAPASTGSGSGRTGMGSTSSQDTRTRPTATAARIPAGIAAILRLNSRLGKLRAGNVYDRADRLYRLGVWRVGGRVHLVPGPARARPFKMALTKVSPASVTLIFAGCGATSKKTCGLYAARLSPAGAVKRVSRVLTGARV